MENMPNIFGIRHLSPAGAFYLRKYLDEKKPKLVLVEGPSDFNDMMSDMVDKRSIPPIAIMAYTKEENVRTILYPFAKYSPEYQAILWCNEKRVECKFFDMPSDAFLALGNDEDDEDDEDDEEINDKEIDDEKIIDSKINTNNTDNTDSKLDVYEKLDLVSGEGGEEDFWERTMEHIKDCKSYHEGANLFGSKLREMTKEKDSDWQEIILRESYMKSQIRKYVDSGISPNDIVIVCGSYHVDGLLDWRKEEDVKIKTVSSMHTLMPYSYYRLSTRSGYGAGNKAPSYYHLLWESLNLDDDMNTSVKFLTNVARYLREKGNMVSSASVIEAVRLAKALSYLRGDNVVTLRDLKDACITCFAEGKEIILSEAFAFYEIGTRIGSLADGVSKTCIQDDFYQCLKNLKLEKYKSAVNQNLSLDLRENRRVKSKEAAYLDLNRSFFLHRLRVLGIEFAKINNIYQEKASYAENWTLAWTPEVEISLIESALIGDTIKLAVCTKLSEQIKSEKSIQKIAKDMEDAFLCGLSNIVKASISALQALSIDAVSIEEMAECMEHLTSIINYGSIRKIDYKPLRPVMNQLYYHYCMLLPQFCFCDENASSQIILSIERVDKCNQILDFLEDDEWIKVLDNIAKRDDLNTKISGFCTAILLERGILDIEQLEAEVSRRLSKGIPADLGSAWFEGLAMKNHYALINRLYIWEMLDTYIQSLDDEEYKRALLFLRRTFCEFSANEKHMIAENLGEVWGLDGLSVSEAVNSNLDKEASEMIDELEDFDFDF